jgi:peptide/nickel transport system substrate-binding protein
MKSKYLLATLALTALSAFAQSANLPKDGGTLKVGVATSSLTNGFDPAVIQGESTPWILGQITEGLLNRDQKFNIVPWLAQSWTISKDGRAYTFKLREGVKFSIERMLDPKTGSRRRLELSVIDSIAVVDANTVTFMLKEPFAPFLSTLAGVWASIIPKEAVNPDGSITNLIGTGPFAVAQASKDKIALKKFDGYWRKGEPHVDNVTFVPVPEDASRMSALRTGAVDLITAVPNLLLPVLAHNKERGFELLVTPSTVWHMAIMNTTKPPFNDVRVRQAVNLAIDRNQLVQALTSGFGRVDNQTWEKGAFWRFKGDVPKPDPARARALLAEAGYKNGVPITIECKPEYRRDAQVIQSQLNAVGFKATIQVSDWVALNQRMKAYNFQLAISSSNRYNDPDFRFSRFYLKTGPANYFAGGYENAKVTELLTEGRVESVPEKRKETYQQVFDIVERDVPNAMLYFEPRTLAWRENVKGFQTDADGDLALADGGLAKVWLSR